MKYLVLLILIILPSQAQIGEVKEINGLMSHGTQHGFQILVPEAEQKRVEKAWINLMKDYESKTIKIKKEKDLLSAEAQIPAVSSSPVSVYSNFQETPEGIYLNTFIDLGSSYLSSTIDQEKADAVNKILTDFAKSVAIAAIEDEIKKEEKSLKRLEKEQSGLEKNQKQYTKEIEDAEKLIADRTKQLEQNAIDQIAKKRGNY